MFAVLASAGLPVAVSRMISETMVNDNRDEAERIYKVSLRVFALIGVVASCLMFFGADIIAGDHFLNNPKVAYSIRVLAITALCSFLMSPLRGYFQGHSIMIHTALSQSIEAFAKLCIGILIASLFIQPEYQSAGAIAGVSIGAILSVIYLLIVKKKYTKTYVPRGMPVRSDKELIKQLFIIAIPVSLGASVMSVVNVIDDWSIMNILQNGIIPKDSSFVLGNVWKEAPEFLTRIFDTGLGMTNEQANLLNGIFGNAKKIFNLPSAFIIPFTVSILPVLTSAFTAKDKDGIAKNMTNCFKYSALLAFPAGIGIIVLAKPIMNILFPSEEMEIGAPLLSIFGIAVILYAFVSITGSILQAFGKVNKPLISLCVGGVLKCILTIVLVSIPTISIMGAPIATVVCYIVMIIMNLLFLRKFFSGCGAIITNILKIAVAASVMGVCTFFVYRLLEYYLGINIGGIVTIAVAVILYVVLVFLFGIVTKSEIKSIIKKDKTKE